MPDPYKKPYWDSDVFIGWIKGERVPETLPDGSSVTVDRGQIAEHLLTLAEQRVFPVVISGLTFAEVQKHKGKPKLTDDENDNVLDYFEHDFVIAVPVDRAVGEAANKLCRQYETERLSPNDGVHLAAALKAGCDVLLTWDRVLLSINHPGIKIMRPEIWTPVRIPKAVQMPLLPP